MKQARVATVATGSRSKKATPTTGRRDKAKTIHKAATANTDAFTNAWHQYAAPLESVAQSYDSASKGFPSGFPNLPSFGHGMDFGKMMGLGGSEGIFGDFAKAFSEHSMFKTPFSGNVCLPSCKNGKHNAKCANSSANKNTNKNDTGVNTGNNGNKSIDAFNNLTFNINDPSLAIGSKEVQNELMEWKRDAMREASEYLRRCLTAATPADIMKEHFEFLSTQFNQFGARMDSMLGKISKNLSSTYSKQNDVAVEKYEKIFESLFKDPDDSRIRSTKNQKLPKTNTKRRHNRK